MSYRKQRPTAASRRYKLLVLFTGAMLVLLYLPPFNSQESPESRSSDVLVHVDLFSGTEKIFGGEMLVAGIEVVLPRQRYEDVVDVVMTYTITDSSGTVILRSEETKSGLLRIQTVKELAIPSNAFPGSYTLTVQASYSEAGYDEQNVWVERSAQGEAGASFEVLKKTFVQQAAPALVPILLVLFIIVFGALLYYLHRKFAALTAAMHKISESDLKRHGLIK